MFGSMLVSIRVSRWMSFFGIRDFDVVWHCKCCVGDLILGLVVSRKCPLVNGGRGCLRNQV